MISDEEKDQVRAASDLVAIVQETVELKPRGHEFWGCCPFHGEKTPSFHIIPATQVWHCFGCGEGGDVFTYIMKRENLSFPESIRYLADRAGIELHDTGAYRERGTKRARIYDLCAETAQFYHTMLMRGKDSRPREYFASRGMGGDVCRRYCLGFAPGRNALVSHLSQAGFTPQEMIDANVAVSRGRGQLADRFYDRVMFPIFDEQGHNIAFGGRIMGDGQPKYLNTAETSVFHKKRNLYGFNWAKEFIVAQDTAIVVEGYTDCIACWEAGIKNVVATLGTADKFLFVIHGRDTVEHMVTRIADVAENLLFKRQHARLVEITRAGEEILAVGVFAAERPGDEVAAVVEALARNKVVALLVPTGRMDARDIAALSLSERLGAYAGERLASATQAVELGEFLKAALFGGALVFIERE